MNSTEFKNEFMYNDDQRIIIGLGRDDQDDEFGNIDDLNPKKYNWKQMYRISLGRGEDTVYGNIDDLNPSEYNANQMHMISLDRGVPTSG